MSIGSPGAALDEDREPAKDYTFCFQKCSIQPPFEYTVTKLPFISLLSKVLVTYGKQLEYKFYVVFGSPKLKSTSLLLTRSIASMEDSSLGGHFASFET